MAQLNICIVLLALTSSIQALSLDIKEEVFGNIANVPGLFRNILATLAISSAIDSLPPPPENFELYCMKEFDVRSIKNKYSNGLEQCLDANSTTYKKNIELIEIAKQELMNDLKGMMTITALTGGFNYLKKVVQICEDASEEVNGLECVKNLKPELLEGLQKINDDVKKCMEN